MSANKMVVGSTPLSLLWKDAMFSSAFRLRQGGMS